MPVKRHHERPEVPAVIFQWGGSARRGGGAACSQASGTASETECVKAAEEMRGDLEGQGAVWANMIDGNPRIGRSQSFRHLIYVPGNLFILCLLPKRF